MSLHTYLEGRRLYVEDAPFYSYIQAAMRKADSDNLAKLKEAWPEQWRELQARYNEPGGILPEDRP